VMNITPDCIKPMVNQVGAVIIVGSFSTDI
jgi:hypothetical protein